MLYAAAAWEDCGELSRIAVSKLQRLDPLTRATLVWTAPSLLTGKKVLTGPKLWRVYDNNGVETADPGGVLLRDCMAGCAGECSAGGERRRWLIRAGAEAGGNLGASR